MRIIKWILGIVVVLGIVFFAGGYLLPREVTVARSVEIEAGADAVFPHVNSLKATEAWSPWLARDPAMQISYSGPDAGIGAKSVWTSESQGNGSQEITGSEADKLVQTVLDFGQMGTAKAEFVLNSAGSATEVTWTMVADMGAGPMGRWMGLMMDNWVGSDFDTGLQSLKTVVEGGA